MKLLKRKNTNTDFWILQISGWGLLWLIYVFLYSNRKSDVEALLGLFLTEFTGFLTSLVLRYFYKKINYKARSILFLSFIVIMGAMVASNIWLWLDIFLSTPLHGFGKLIERLSLRSYLGTSYSHLFVLLTWSALYFGIKLWKEWVLQKDRAEKANILAQSAQLKMLRYQLNPHFLFNALNSIRALIEEDRIKARAMVTELAEFLRYSLVSKNYSNVPLSDEIEALRHYFEIQAIRYEEKLEVTFNIEPMAEDYPVLSFLIHPLVENAVKYGMRTSPMPLKIRINATVIDGMLKIEICNTGKWIEPEKRAENKDGTGTGLENIRQRLENAYPGKHSFEVTAQNGRVCVVLQILSEPNYDQTN
ncbi:histidine kinase [candidate division KSB1 bacterium]|nr:histidine kinase [candidate division KSB1 bacterium]